MVVWTSGKCIEFIKEYQKKIYVIFIQRFSVSPNKFWMAYFFQWNGKKFIFYKFIFENILFCLSYPPFFFQSVQTSEFNWMKYYHSFYYKFAMTRRNEVIQCDYVKVHLIYTKQNKWDIFWNIQCHENEHRSVTQTRTINFRFDSCIGFAMRSHPIRLTLYNRRSCRPEFIILSTPPGNSIIIPRSSPPPTSKGSGDYRDKTRLCRTHVEVYIVDVDANQTVSWRYWNNCRCTGESGSDTARCRVQFDP